MSLAIVDRGNALTAWSDEATAAANIAKALAPTPFVPDSLRVYDRGRVDLGATTAVIAAALLTGHELGLTPMASLRAIDVIKGTPALRAVALRALLQQAGHKIWLVESTKTRCVMRGQRAGDDHVQESTWTLDRARDLGLVSKPNWRAQPQNMLVARATAEVARLVAADAVLGLPYIAEEVADDDLDHDGPPPGDTESAAPAAAPKRTARRRNAPTSSKPPAASSAGGVLAPTQASPLGDEPSLDDERRDQDTRRPADEPAPELRTEEQSRALHAALRRLGITDRDEALAEISGWIGRTITSTKELYRAEASTAIEAAREAETRKAAEREEIERRGAETIAAIDEQAAEHERQVQTDLDDWLREQEEGRRDDDEPPTDDR